MPTYREVQAEVRRKHDFTPKTCWIAHVLSDHGKTGRTAPNRIDPSRRAEPCPWNKRGPIESVLKKLGMI